MHVIYCSYCTIRKKAQLALFCTLRAYFVETLKHNKIYSLNRPDMQKTPDFYRVFSNDLKSREFCSRLFVCLNYILIVRSLSNSAFNADAKQSVFHFFAL